MTRRIEKLIIALMLTLVVATGCAIVDPLRAQAVTNFSQLELDGPSPALDVTGFCIELDFDNDTSVCADTDDQIDFELGGADVFVFADAPDAGAGGDLLDITDTLAIMDGPDTFQGLDLNVTGANHTGTGNVIGGIAVDLTTADVQAVETALTIGGSWDLAADYGSLPVLSSQVYHSDDFDGTALDTAWVHDSGSAASDGALTVAQLGTLIMTTDADNAWSADYVSVQGAGAMWSADQGGMVIEARLKMDDNADEVSVCLGWTDTATEEEWGTVSGDTWTITADDTIAFCYNDVSTTQEWFALATDSVGGDATGIGPTGDAVTANTYQTLRIYVDATTDEAFFYIDGTLTATLTGDVFLETTLMIPFLMVDNSGTGVDVVTVDYIAFWVDRAGS